MLSLFLHLQVSGFGDDDGFGLIPAVGDFVEIPRSRMGEREVYRGRVCRRLFRHVLGYVYVRVVIAEVDDKEWANPGC